MTAVSPWARITQWMADWRCRISQGVFVLLVVQNLALGLVPQHVVSLTQPLGTLAVATVLLGVAIRSWAAGTLRKGVALTTEGPYRVCRHPLYLGTLLIMLGFCLLIPHVLNFLLTGLSALVGYYMTMLNEERKLANKYGDAWTQYAAATPRLLPLGLLAGVSGQWSVRQWLSSREYQAALTAPLVVTCLLVWHAYAG